MSMKRTLIVDIETYRDFFYVGMLRVDDGSRRGFEMSSRCDVGTKRQSVAKFLHQYQTVGYNSLSYDLPMLWYWIEGADNDDLKRASDRIITGNVKWWDVEDLLGIRIPWKVKNQHIDLIEPQPNAFASLKILNGRLHGKQMQDLPLHQDETPTHAQMDIIGKYCLHSDLDATNNVLTALKAPLDLRRKLSDANDINLMSKSDTQMGLALIKKRVEKITGKKIGRGKATPGATFRYTPPEYIEFSAPQMQCVLQQIKEHDFIVNKHGKVDLPTWLKEETIRIGTTEYSIGIGGLHSTESGRAIKATNTHALVDEDVESFYPSIILESGLYPHAVGRVFLDIYGNIKTERIHAKHTGDDVVNKSGKIQLNGCFGSLGSPHSFVYAPHLLLAVTLTGQLSLLMLIEHAENAGIPVVSGNTDGIVLTIPRELWDGLDGDRPRPSAFADVIERWEQTTGFKLEGTEYSAVYSQNVNSYFALKKGGGHKRKGPLGNPWNTDPADFDICAQLMKNPQMTICSDAALYRIKHGTPVEDTIRGCSDMSQFVTVIKTTGGATWRDEYLGKVVRYYWSVDGAPLIKVKAHETTGVRPKVPKTDGAHECMYLPDAIPENIDYDRYISEAYTILKSLGFYGDVLPPEKPIRLTIKNRFALGAAYATAI